MKGFFTGSTIAFLLTASGFAATIIGPTQASSVASSLTSLSTTLVEETAASLPQKKPVRRLTKNDSPVISTISHPWKNKRLATTLRINSLPVVTFLGNEAALQQFQAGQPLAASDNPIQAAEAIANQLEQLSQSPEFDATKITAAWDSKAKQYQVKVAEQVLVVIDANFTLPEKQLSPQQTTLQTTNRLRRLLGSAAPLTAIAGAPKPTVTIPNATNATLNRIKGGMASWYGPGFHGRRTANGERFNQHGLTAAHRYLPFGTKVKVTNVRTGKSVVVRINDRGPFAHGRVIDLSAAAAKVIGVHRSGVAPVSIDVIQ